MYAYDLPIIQEAVYHLRAQEVMEWWEELCLTCEELETEDGQTLPRSEWDKIMQWFTETSCFCAGEHPTS
jgi:hypothetical protein